MSWAEVHKITEHIDRVVDDENAYSTGFDGKVVYTSPSVTFEKITNGVTVIKTLGVPYYPTKDGFLKIRVVGQCKITFDTTGSGGKTNFNLYVASLGSQSGGQGAKNSYLETILNAPHGTTLSTTGVHTDGGNLSNAKVNVTQTHGSISPSTTETVDLTRELLISVKKGYPVFICYEVYPNDTHRHPQVTISSLTISE